MSGDYQLNFLPTYWTFAFASAAGFYTVIIWFGNRHLSQENKDSLTLWLWGDYESTWTHHFCSLFDAAFGSRHLSWRCFLGSSVASVLAVLMLYILFSEIIGVMGKRAAGDLDFRKALLLGAAINIIPDYLSLFETRWLLKRFEHVRSFIGELAMLVADAVFTGTIICLSINVFQLIRGVPVLSAVEMLALFSVYSLFFYSTFVTSLWAWIYCLSTWIMRLFHRRRLNKHLDVDKKPVDQVALIGAVLLFGIAFILTPILKTDKERQVSVVDDMLCSVFAKDACSHLARLTTDEKRALDYLGKACMGGATEHCIRTAFDHYGVEAVAFLEKACEGGIGYACVILGSSYSEGEGTGIGVDEDDVRGAYFFQKACDLNDRFSCIVLADVYRHDLGVEQHSAKIASLEQKYWSLTAQACEGGDALACDNLGSDYLGRFEEKGNIVKALSFFQQACDLGRADICYFIAQFYEVGHAVEEDATKAAALYRRACKMGVRYSCDRASNGKVVDRLLNFGTSHLKKGTYLIYRIGH